MRAATVFLNPKPENAELAICGFPFTHPRLNASSNSCSFANRSRPKCALIALAVNVTR